MAEKESDKTVTMVEKESDETVTMSRADTVSRTEGGQTTYNSKNSSGAHAQRASEVQAIFGSSETTMISGAGTITYYNIL